MISRPLRAIAPYRPFERFDIKKEWLIVEGTTPPPSFLKNFRERVRERERSLTVLVVYR